MKHLVYQTYVHKALTEAIADAESCGANADIDALLLAKVVLLRREIAMAHREPSKGPSCV